jgi:hypothetical protein
VHTQANQYIMKKTTLDTIVQYKLYCSAVLEQRFMSIMCRK